MKRPRKIIRILLIGISLQLSGLLLAAEPKANTVESMTQERLHAIIHDFAEVIREEGSVVEFTHGETLLICISDSSHDRMRIIAPITETRNLQSDQLMICLQANFHTVLDARYAIANGMLYAAYIHPLSPLEPEQVESAIRQVASAHRTFGTTYTSGELLFPPGESEEESAPKPKADVQTI